jgi:N-methylhydantoinase B
MTNSLNTPAEALEYAYPLRVREYRLRNGSGGKGKYRGGDGVVREIETIVSARMSLLAERRSVDHGLQEEKLASREQTRSFVAAGARRYLPRLRFN